MNEEYDLVVSEPWNYSGVDGTNKISGTIVRRIGDRCLVFRSLAPVRIGADVGDLFVLHPRYEKESFIAGVSEVPSNVGLLLTEEYDTLDEKQLEKNSRFVIIGSLRKH